MKGFGCGEWGLSKGEFWVVGRANAQDPQGWKRPWELWGWGLGSRNRRGPGMPLTPGLRVQGTSPGSPAGFLGSSGWGKLPPLLLLLWSVVWEAPSCLPLLISPALGVPKLSGLHLSSLLGPPASY